MFAWFANKEDEINKSLEEYKVKIGELEQELATVGFIKDYLYKNYVVNEAQALFEKYISNITGYCSWQQVENDGVLGAPNEKLMRKVEETIGISENAKKAFREEVLIRMSSYQRKGKKFDYTSHDRLRLAIERSL
jgi:serine protein kinase